MVTIDQSKQAADAQSGQGQGGFIRPPCIGQYYHFDDGYTGRIVAISASGVVELRPDAGRAGLPRFSSVNVIGKFGSVLL